MGSVENSAIGGEADDQAVELGAVYRLELATMPFAVWSGDRFVGPRTRARLRMLETATRAEGGFVQRVGEVAGVLLAPELVADHCVTCDWDVKPFCKPRSHLITEEPVPNRPLLAAIDVVIEPWLEAEAETRAAAETGEILLRAFRWEADEGYPYLATPTELGALRRRRRQLPDDSPERLSIDKHFPQLGGDDAD